MQVPNEDRIDLLAAVLFDGERTDSKTRSASGVEKRSRAGVIRILDPTKTTGRPGRPARPDSEVRARRVAALQQGVASGEYRPGGEEIAEKLIKTVLAEAVSRRRSEGWIDKFHRIF